VRARALRAGDDRAVNVPAREWDARTYDRVSEPQLAWGLEVLERLELRGDETVLDAGCGSGRVTLELLERLPRGRVVAVDASAAMVEQARAALRDRAEVLRANLVDLRLPEPVDAILSTAVFHWIPDHARLFAALHAALRPGGRLEAQCGGAGNIEAVHAELHVVCAEPRWAPHFVGWAGPWNFATPDETAQRLAAAGFEAIDCRLERRPVHPPEPEEFLRTVCLGHHLERLPEHERPAFVRAVSERLGPRPELDYVRLNISARRPG
jgi:trans-aconitate 2-methyltransferase